MWYLSLISLCLFALATAEDVQSGAKDDIQRESKLSIFQVVKFANSECTGSSKNGTCFTKAECENLGGTNSGSCADGFGVCCIMTITSGQSSSVNNTYISLSSDESSGSHFYKICPCSDDICRIKFDFNDFTLAGPTSGQGTVTSAITAANMLNAIGIGRCTTDQFQIISPSGRSSPLICGDNDNQHMILETCNDECLMVNVGLGASTTVTRELDIRVMQYRCGEESGGPPGCLQYFENTSGKIRSFNFPDTTAGATLTYNYAIHLVNQHYKACVRRANSYEVICYTPCTLVGGGIPDIEASSNTAQASFGLSITEETAGSSSIGTDCSMDYVWIPMGLAQTQFTSAIAHQDAVSDAEEIAQPVRYCGNILGTSILSIAVTATTQTLTTHTASVCSYNVPFELGVEFDDSEFCTADEDPSVCESVVISESIGGGGGILGFSLCYVQHVPPIS